LTPQQTQHFTLVTMAGVELDEECPVSLEELKTLNKPPIDLTGVDIHGPTAGISTHNDNAALIWQHSGRLQGEVPATFKEMLDTFGVPMDGGFETKISAQWCVRFPNGARMRLYDWCETQRYKLDPALPTVEEFLDVTSHRTISWHINGSDDAVELVTAALAAANVAEAARIKRML